MHTVFLGVIVAFLVSISSLSPATAQSSKDPVKIAIIGDDFINGAGLFSPNDSFVVQLQRFARKKMDIRDYSKTGATTASTYSQIDAIVADAPEIAIVAIGLNDALARTNPDVVYSNLDNILRELGRGKIYTLLITMQAPPSVDQTYAMSFNSVYPKVAQQHNVVILDQFYSPIFNDTKLLQMDRLHPNKFGVELMAQKAAKVISSVMINNLKEARRCYKQGASRSCEFRKQKF